MARVFTLSSWSGNLLKHMPNVFRSCENDEDQFAQFAQQKPASVAQSEQYSAQYQEPQSQDGMVWLAELLKSSQRQEEVLGRVCTFLADLGQRVDSVAAAQERLEAQFASGQVAGAGEGAGGYGAAAEASAAVDPRGQIVQPLGTPDYKPPGPSLASSASVAAAAAQRAEKDRLDKEKMEAERRRLEEEERRRLAEIAEKKAQEDARRAEEFERKRQEQLRREEEERKKKTALEQKTSNLMGNLITSDSSGLFGNDPHLKKKAGGLFDD